MLLAFDNVPLYKFLKIKRSQKNKKYADYVSNRNEEVANFVLNKIKISEKALDYFENNGKQHINMVNQTRRWIRKLVYVRNKLFKSLKELQYNGMNKDGVRLLFPFDKKDHMGLIPSFKELKQKGYFSNFNIWKIGKKKGQDYSSDIELSEE
mmetsp:Transcript_21706/g.19234  ORF Transcript_21706/g.19234 Transcript_21706/m.19234 type:complete len:152 (+) Transcript_21706:507-962(+)